MTGESELQNDASIYHLSLSVDQPSLLGDVVKLFRLILLKRC